jgi:hypothetical protein
MTCDTDFFGCCSISSVYKKFHGMLLLSVWLTLELSIPTRYKVGILQAQERVGKEGVSYVTLPLMLGLNSNICVK